MSWQKISGTALCAIIAGVLLYTLGSGKTGAGPAPRTFTVEITGNGEQFTGDLLVVDTAETSRTVTGRTPATYTVQGSSVSVSVQKQSADAGAVGITISTDGAVVAQEATSAAYGVVTAAGQ